MSPRRKTTSDRTRVAIERRPSDFDQTGQVTLYQGSCCCCCLHWIGAAMGGTAGIVIGWRWGRRKLTTPLHPRAKKYLLCGLVVGVVGVVGTAILGINFPSQLSLLGLVVFVPSVVFIPIGATMMISARLVRRFTQQKYGEPITAEGCYCLKCLYNLRGSLQSTNCPECGEPIDHAKLAKGMDFGLGMAWRITWLSFLLATLLGGVGYLVMLPWFLSINT